VVLNPEQLQVASFATTSAEADAVLQPVTAPNCYSPKCMPTALPEQCPETRTVVQTGAVGD
jgi:hypothetical protein